MTDEPKPDDYPELQHRALLVGASRSSKDMYGYPDLRAMYPPTNGHFFERFGEAFDMNPIDPDRMNRSRHSGNDKLTNVKSTDAETLTANRAALIANEMRGRCHVEDAEAIHVNHRNGLEERYQVNVLISRQTLHPDIFEEYESDHPMELYKPQATEDGNLILQYRVTEVEVNEAGLTGNEWVMRQNGNDTVADRLEEQDIDADEVVEELEAEVEAEADEIAEEMRKNALEELETVTGVNSTRAMWLYEAGFESVADLIDAEQSELAEALGGQNALAARIKADVIEEDDDEGRRPWGWN